LVWVVSWWTDRCSTCSGWSSCTGPSSAFIHPQSEVAPPRPRSCLPTLARLPPPRPHRRRRMIRRRNIRRRQVIALLPVQESREWSGERWLILHELIYRYYSTVGSVLYVQKFLLLTTSSTLPKTDQHTTHLYIYLLSFS
jgi:hypothetical protein